MRNVRNSFVVKGLSLFAVIVMCGASFADTLPQHEEFNPMELEATAEQNAQTTPEVEEFKPIVVQMKEERKLYINGFTFKDFTFDGLTFEEVKMMLAGAAGGVLAWEVLKGTLRLAVYGMSYCFGKGKTEVSSPAKAPKTPNTPRGRSRTRK